MILVTRIITIRKNKKSVTLGHDSNQQLELKLVLPSKIEPNRRDLQEIVRNDDELVIIWFGFGVNGGVIARVLAQKKEEKEKSKMVVVV